MERLYVDTNVFIRLFEGNDELTNALADLFLIERPDDDPFLATSELTLAEALVKPYRNSDNRLIERYDSWTISNPYLEVGPVDRQVLWYAAVLRSQYPALKLPDAIRLSTAIGMNCTHFLSADVRLSNRYELVHNRYGGVKQAKVIEILRPGVKLVRDIVAEVRAHYDPIASAARSVTMPHSHSHAHARNEKRLAIAAALTGLFMLAEVAGGLISGSLALLADAGHMLTDFASLSLAWFAFHLARRPADWKRTYGFDRLQVLVAFVNGLALFVIAGWIVWEAAERLMAPGTVLGGLMLGVATGGLVVNIIAFLVLHGADRDNLNIRGAALHVMGDLLGSVAAIVAAGVIIATGWTPIDPILSVLVAMIILRSAWYVVRESGHILLEGAPADVEADSIAPDLVKNLKGVRDVHHVHVWSITQERQMVTLHAVIDDKADAASLIRRIKERLRTRFGLAHATIEIEHGQCADELRGAKRMAG